MKKSEFIELWTQALESGKYKQGKSLLWQKGNKYCCLGVACVIAQETGVRQIEIEKDNDEFLPSTLARFLNMTTAGSFKEPVVYGGKDFTNLADMNDEGVTFKEIANVIREQIKAKNFKGKNE